MEERRRIDWTYVIIGIAAFAFAWYVHDIFTRLEAHGGSVAIPRFAILIYQAVGKWGVVGLISFVAAGMVVLGLKGGHPSDRK